MIHGKMPQVSIATAELQSYNLFLIIINIFKLIFSNKDRLLLSHQSYSSLEEPKETKDNTVLF